MPLLLQEHVAQALPFHPFEFTGIDYFGPLYIKQFVQESDTTVKKAWVSAWQ